jgi:hypothetical protein
VALGGHEGRDRVKIALDEFAGPLPADLSEVFGRQKFAAFF